MKRPTTILEALDVSDYSPEVRELARHLDHETSYGECGYVSEVSIFNNSDISNSDCGYLCADRTKWILDYVETLLKEKENEGLTYLQRKKKAANPNYTPERWETT